MSQETTKHKDQAEHLKQLFNEVQQHEGTEAKIVKTEDVAQELKVDVLNLPPRKEVHGTNVDRARLKLGKPFLRFLTVLMIMIAIIVGAYFVWTEELINIIKNL